MSLRRLGYRAVARRPPAPDRTGRYVAVSGGVRLGWRPCGP